MAVNDMVVRILGDSRSVERAFARSSKAANQFNRNIETTGAKIDKNTKRVSSFAKGTAVGFGGAFALTEAISIVKNLAEQAADSQNVLGQTRVALETTGKSWAKYSDQIQETVKAQSRLGFDDEALLRTFSLFARNTDSVGEALRRNNLAMDVARGRFIDLESAALLVNKAALGQAGALRRLGIDAKVGSSSVELLTLLTEKYGGAAEAASGDAVTTFARTQVAVENLQESVGTLLLPALEKLAGGLEEVATFAQNASDALNKLGKIKIPKIEIPFLLTIGGQSVGDAAGSLLSKAKFTPLNPLFGITVANAIADQFRDQAKAATPTLAQAMQETADQMVQDALGLAPTFGITKLPKGPTARGKQLIAAEQAAKEQQEVIDRFRKANAAKNEAAAAKSASDAATATAKAEEAAREKAAKEAARRAAIRAKRQAAQFRALGLSAAGVEIIPGIKNLQTRITGALRRIGSGELDVSSKLTERLRLARKLIKKDGKSLTDETRSAINSLIQTVTQGQAALDKTVSGGPLTRTTSLRANPILAGLGLTPDVERELRARLSSFNSAGRALTGTQNRTTGGFRGGVPIVESHVTVNLDGEKVGKTVTKTQQKRKRRNPTQKRGPNGGV